MAGDSSHNTMKKRQNQNRAIVLASIVLLIAVLCLLSFVERSAPNSTIKTPWDAFWYFIVTVTTVGYGDMKPNTIFGQLLGLIFILLSCGLISVVLTASIRFMNGSHILYLRIRSARATKWYIFDSDSQENRCLAGKLDVFHENAGIIFCRTERQLSGLLSFRHINTPLAVRDAAFACFRRSKKYEAELPVIFLTGDDEEENLETALDILAATHTAEVYCRTSVRFDTAPEGLHPFDTADLTARTYWADYPLTLTEKNVILIGSGTLLDDLIEQAVLINTFGPLLRCRYHIFEEPDPDEGSCRERSSFLMDHPHIVDVISVIREETDGETSKMREASDVAGCPDSPLNDVLLFHSDRWNTNHECLKQADRIVVCTSSGIDNIRIAEKIRLLIPTKARIHVCGSTSIDGTHGFGSLRDIYTPELILREDLLRRARALNDYYNNMQTDPSRRTAWEDLDMFTRRSNIAATDHMGTKLRILTGNLENSKPVTGGDGMLCLAMDNFVLNVVDRDLCRRIEHERWMRFHSLYGWTYGEVRDKARRKHPLMVPFEDLTPKEQALDDISWEILATLYSCDA